MFNINEIFDSVQFEGIIHHGKFARFLRLAGCNLNCPWCDTDHTPKYKLEVAELALRLRAGLTAELIVLTGGEPMLQVDEDLIRAFYNVGLRAHIETNATCSPLFNIQPHSPCPFITASPKAGAEVVLEAKHIDELKIVLDGEIHPEKYAHLSSTRFIQPCWPEGELDTQVGVEEERALLMRQKQAMDRAVEYVMEHPWWRLSMQMHKVLGIR